MTRRESLGLLAAAAVPGAGQKSWPVCMFSKHFQWTGIEEMSAICAKLGFDGIDLTLRPGGHVEPERVEDELPKTVAIIHRAGLATPMVTSHIIDPQTPHAEKVMRTLQKLGIRRYRWDGFRYDPKLPIPAQLAAIKPRVRDLAAMNKQFGLTAMYHTHSGVNRVGASQWDLYELLKDFSPDQVAANYDIGHATVEGGFGGWVHSARLMAPHSRGIALKDFKWEKGPKTWRPGWCAFGQGMVDFKQFLGIFKAAGYQGPIQMHYEYDELGGADTGKKQMSISKDRFVEILARDLAAARAVLSEVGMV